MNKTVTDFWGIYTDIPPGVMWATSVKILVFLGLSILDLGPMYATDRQTDVRHTSDSIIA